MGNLINLYHTSSTRITPLVGMYKSEAKNQGPFGHPSAIFLLYPEVPNISRAYVVHFQSFFCIFMKTRKIQQSLLGVWHEEGMYGEDILHLAFFPPSTWKCL